MSEAAKHQVNSMGGVILSRYIVNRRAVIVHALLFLASYAAFLFVARPQDAQQVTVANTVTQGMERMMFGGSFVGQSRTQPAIVQTANVANAQSVSSTATLPQAVTATQEASTLVPDYSSPQRQMASLEEAARFDDSPANRVAGIAGLQQLASSGGNSTAILDALRAAAQDGDPAVAGAAQQAYDQVKAMTAQK